MDRLENDGHGFVGLHGRHDAVGIAMRIAAKGNAPFLGDAPFLGLLVVVSEGNTGAHSINRSQQDRAT